MLWTGGNPSKEAQSLLEQIRHLTVILNSKPICRSLPRLPDVVQALNLMGPVADPPHQPHCNLGQHFTNEITNRDVIGVNVA
ncbi:hypothetical protein ACLK1U_03440 [Escherichia coli]